MEAVFQPELSRIFSDNFRPFPTRKHRELVGIHRKKIPKTSGRNTASISGAFPRDTVAFPYLSCRIRWPESSSWEEKSIQKTHIFIESIQLLFLGIFSTN
jgi:hypothetical protein